MGTDKNIKLHIVTDIKANMYIPQVLFLSVILALALNTCDAAKKPNPHGRHGMPTTCFRRPGGICSDGCMLNRWGRCVVSSNIRRRRDVDALDDPPLSKRTDE